MNFEYDTLLESLQAKVNLKLEEMKHQYAQSMFDSINENWYAYDKEDDDVIGGPFTTKDRAYKFATQSKRKNVEVLDAVDLERKYGIIS